MDLVTASMMMNRMEQSQVVAGKRRLLGMSPVLGMNQAFDPCFLVELAYLEVVHMDFYLFKIKNIIFIHRLQFQVAKVK